MSARLVTVATFASSVEGNLARNRLEDLGIKAVLADEETVGTAWHLTNALGGVKLQVEEEDAEAALAVLAEGQDAIQPTPAIREQAPFAPPEPRQPPRRGRAADAEAEPAPTAREQDAARAFRGAIFGMLFPPLQLYVFWLLFKVFLSDERLAQDKRWLVFLAAVINVPLILGFGILLRVMFWG